MAALMGRYCIVVMHHVYMLYVHCLISRFSRRIMWAKVSASNNNPYIITQYYLECVSIEGGIYYIS